MLVCDILEKMPPDEYIYWIAYLGIVQELEAEARLEAKREAERLEKTKPKPQNRGRIPHR
tara:strand:- start:1779 stop:1958 length:180 start_codon:yes stop_codon:yes gene_type:complete